MHLRISPTIANEWSVRCIGDIIPALADTIVVPGNLQVSKTTLRDILADCRFMADPKAIDATPSERRAYRSLFEQCERALAGA